MIVVVINVAIPTSNPKRDQKKKDSEKGILSVGPFSNGGLEKEREKKERGLVEWREKREEGWTQRRGGRIKENKYQKQTLKPMWFATTMWWWCGGSDKRFQIVD